MSLPDRADDDATSISIQSTNLEVDSVVMDRSQVSVEFSGGDVYRVVVTQGRGTTTHEVTATPEDVARYAPGSTPERPLEAALRVIGRMI